MDDDNIGPLILAVAGVYLLASGKLKGLFGDSPKDDPSKSASGEPLKNPRTKKELSTEDKIAAGTLGTICAAAGTYYGGPAAGKAAGGYCAGAAPEAWKGLKTAYQKPGEFFRGAYDPLGFTGGDKGTFAQWQTFRGDLAKKGGAAADGCGGWRGACETPPGPAPYNRAPGKPQGFR